MTKKTFYKKLGLLKNKYKWKVDKDGTIRTVGESMCPDIAVSHHINKNNEYNNDLKETIHNRNQIWRAADKREPYSKPMRAALLRRLGLKEIK